jgi:hypothetical protein
MSMLLKSEDGNEFELALIEDRFPEQQDDFDDSTYTTISYRVSTPDEAWEETAPCMNLFELKNLEEWLDALARGTPEVAEVQILEPELTFSVVGDAGNEVTVRVAFRMEDEGPAEDRSLSYDPNASGVGKPAARRVGPDELTSLGADTPEAPWVDIRTSRDKIAAAVAELHEDLAHATTGHPRTERAAERDSGIAGLPDEGLNILDEDSPAVDETDPDRKF